MCPLTAKGKKVKRKVIETYTKKGKSPKEAESIFYAIENKGKVKGLAKKKGKKK